MRAALAGALAFVSLASVAQPSRTVRFDAHEGTWMSVDVSPCGQQIAFDLLGDLYVLPIAGGKARRLTSGPATDFAPRFSPDGQHIAFASDRSGIENLWAIGIDGSGLTRITHEDSLETSPESIGTPRWSSDGQSLSPDDTKGYGALLGLDDRPRGELTSPDGRSVAYFLIDPRGGRRLYLRHRPSGESRQIAVLDYPAEHGHPTQYIPGYAFTPDSRSIVMAIEGRIRRIELESLLQQTIEFSAPVEITLAPFKHVAHRIDDAQQLPLRDLGSIERSPEGHKLAFASAGHLWLANVDAPDRLQPLTGNAERAFDPVFSPDGQWIAFLLSEGNALHLWKLKLSNGARVRLTEYPDYYSQPQWLPDGRHIAVLEQASNDQGLDRISGSKTGKELAACSIEVLNADIEPAGSEIGANRQAPERIATIPICGFNDTIRNVLTGPAGITYLDFDPATRLTHLVAVDPETRQRRILARFPLGPGWLMQAAISPDNRFLAIEKDFNIFVMPLSARDTLPVVSTDVWLHPGAFERVSQRGGGNPRWSRDGRVLSWSSANRFECLDVRQPRARANSIQLNPTLPRLLGKDLILLRNARILTMHAAANSADPYDLGIIEHGDLLIRGRKIAAVGPTGTLSVPPSARVISVDGATVMPGLLALHEHIGSHSPNIIEPKPYRYAAALASGITTMFDPAGSPRRYAEFIETGAFPGPRTFGTGPRPSTVEASLSGSLRDATAVGQLIESLRTGGAYMIKQRGMPHRRQRQWVYDEAFKRGLGATNEAGTQPFTSILGMIVDGASGIEHRINLGNLHRDFVQLLAQSGTAYQLSPMIESCPAIPPADYAYPFWPQGVVEQLERRCSTALPTGRDPQGSDPDITTWTSSAREVLHAGGNIVEGTDATDPWGFQFHAELWALKLGGFSNAEILRVATTNGARALGLDRDLGSIEPGKVADLVVLNSDPLEDIRHTVDIRYVAKDGVIYEAGHLERGEVFAESGDAWRVRTTATGLLPDGHRGFGPGRTTFASRRRLNVRVLDWRIDPAR